jgi:hypothetical protein
MERQLLEDIFVTALEGGSNYWYHITAETNQKIRKAVPLSVDPYLATAMLTAILDHGVKVEVHDAENTDEVLGVLNYEDMKDRLAALESDKGYKWALEAHQQEDGDAESADIVFQYLVMGEVWFS